VTDLRAQLEAVAKADVDQLIRKDAEYGSSWRGRGGVGAYMMAARKFDRLELTVQRHGWDIFAAAAADMREEGVLDDIGDLRRYLMLIESHIRASQPNKDGTVREDYTGHPAPFGYLGEE
jgi:hypothetical protein